MDFFLCNIKLEVGNCRNVAFFSRLSGKGVDYVT